MLLGYQVSNLHPHPYLMEQPTIAIRSYLLISFYIFRVELAATIVPCL
ncbi:unnamed protein product [Brassica oleracea]